MCSKVGHWIDTRDQSGIQMLATPPPLASPVVDVHAVEPSRKKGSNVRIVSILVRYYFVQLDFSVQLTC